MAERRTSNHSIRSRPLEDGRASTRFSNPDVFSDEFALEPFDTVDRIVPRPPEDDQQPGEYPPPDRFRRARSIITQADGISSLRQSTGSQKQTPRRGNSLVTRQSLNRRPLSHPAPNMITTTSDLSNVTSLPQRTLSTSSISTVPRTQSPYVGETGPSHPYGMYPQDIAMMTTSGGLTRSSTNTSRAPYRSSSGPSGPTHPYGTYSQNILPEGAVIPAAERANAIPIGFPGLSQPYRRRFELEGEEADDIIGPDGHTEQLPPYTRFPDAFLPKDDNNQALATNPVGLQDGPETEVLEDTSIDQPEPGLFPVQSTSSNDSGRLVNAVASSAAADVDVLRRHDMSGSFKERVTRSGTRRFCRGKVPLWILVLTIAIFAILLGGVIGGAIAHNHKEHQEYPPPDPQVESTSSSSASAPTVTATVTTTALVDATPLTSVPADLPNLVTGTYGVPMAAPTESVNNCLTDPSQGTAWGCVNQAYLNLQIDTLGSGTSQVDLTSGLSPNMPLRYGPQPPSLNEPSNLNLMTDKNNVPLGPAYFFQQAYDKIVVLHESALNAPYSKRWLEAKDVVDLEERDYPVWGSRNQVNTGDKPWFCVWNSTILEGFIFITQNTTAVTTSLPAQPSSTDSYSMTTSLSPASSTSQPPNSSPSSPWKRQQEAPSWPTNLPAPYPYTVKIEERRSPNNVVKPYCQQMQVLNDGGIGPVMNSTGGPILVQLNETEPTTEGWLRPRHEKRQSAPSRCFCAWLYK